MNGNDRRRMELEHPELTLTMEEKQYRTKMMSYFLNKGVKKYMTTTISGAIFVVALTSKFDGIQALSIAFMGTIAVISIGFLMAYKTEIKINNQTKTI